MLEAYLIIDIGTGNARVAVISAKGEVLGVQTEDIQYHKDQLYPDALYFEPKFLWQQVSSMAKALLQTLNCKIIAVTATSQREGIVLVDNNGEALIGLPNIDHRGREWENMMVDTTWIYQLTGRYPTSLFSALKFVGIQQRKPKIAEQTAWIMSISDWVEFTFSGIPHFEHSHASETLWYDVQNKQWSVDLAKLFHLDMALLPSLTPSGTILGKVKSQVAAAFNISADVLVIVGGADTQLAAKSTQPLPNDVVVVSGTTTPIIKISERYQTDEQQRTWTGRHIEPDLYMVETNAGVTGLNYQRLKQVFYPNESYDIMEIELQEVDGTQCVASLGSLVAAEKNAPLKGGFVFDAPVSHLLKRADFVFATLWDIACSIKANYDCLNEVAKHDTDYILACGGGMQSKCLRQLIANLIGKKVLIFDTYKQSSALGGALICNQALGKGTIQRVLMDETSPKASEGQAVHYQAWKNARQNFKQMKA